MLIIDGIEQVLKWNAEKKQTLKLIKKPTINKWNMQFIDFAYRGKYVDRPGCVLKAPLQTTWVFKVFLIEVQLI